MIGLLVITHGSFGSEMLRTAQEMVGRQERVAAIALTPDLGAENLCAAILESVGRLGGPEGLLILVDMLGGTPCNVSLLNTREARVEIVTGVNLSMILSAFMNRGRMDLNALAAKTAEDGRKAVCLPRELLAKKLG